MLESVRDSNPALQLYNATRLNLERLERDFYLIGLDKTYVWTGYFSQAKRFIKTFPFLDSSSSIEAEAAKCTGIYTRDDNDFELTISLTLFKDGSPYCRDSDIELSGNSGYYDIQLAEEIPPTIIPSGVYDDNRQNLSDLHVISKTVGEFLGQSRAQSLIDMISSLSIDQLDLEALDKQEY